MGKPSLKVVVFLFIFFFSWLPLVFSVVGLGNTIITDYSIYNTNWNGLSNFRSIIEKQGYQVKPIISSLSSINRVNTPSVLVIIGPTTFYDPIASTSIIDYLNKGNNIIIADDFGSASEIFTFLGLNIQFSGQLLLDAGSYDKNACLPVITSFSSHQIFQGVNSIELNYATAISGSGFIPLAISSSTSWLDSNANYKYDSGETTGPLTVVAQAYYGNGSIILISDPTLFNNDMINRADNSIFVLNLIKWASKDDTSRLIIVDEGHRSDISSTTHLFGLILGEINWISSNWLLAPLYPLLAIFILRSWMPKRTVKKEVKEEKQVKRSYFSRKLQWYTVSKNYNKAVNVLVTKLKKDLIRVYRLSSFNLEELANKISEYNPEITLKELNSLFAPLEIISKGDKIISDKETFLRIFSDINKFRNMMGLGN